MPSLTTQNHVPSESPADLAAAENLLRRIRNELLELDASFDVDSDLFDAGLDSMAIMQVLLIVEEEFGVQLPDRLVKRETFATARRIAAVVLASARPE